MDLYDKVALITGSKRIGAAVGVALAQRGMDVALVYRAARDEAESAAEAIRALGRRACVLKADLEDPDACGAVVDEAAAALGRLDVLINMASVYREVPFEDTDATVWNEVLNVDLRAAFLCARAAVPHMRVAGEGRIVNFSDWVAASGRPRYPGYVAYYVAKAGVVALTEALALELAGEQILVNAVAPGPIIAPSGTTPEQAAAVVAATPLGRWGGEAEIATAVLFLLESGFTTGETIRVDGGRHVR